MQVNSISLGLKPSVSLMARKAEQGPQAPQEPAQDQKTASLYFTGDSNKSNPLKRAAYALLIPASMLTAASCDKDTAIAEAIVGPINIHIVDSSKTTCGHCGDGSTERDTIYIPDTVRIPGDTIIQWKDRIDRPEPLDTLMNNIHHWDIDNSVDPGDSTGRRNITHFDVTREWEYNTRLVGDADAYNSTKKKLVYDTQLFDYKGNYQSSGKMVLRETSAIEVINAKGDKIKNPKGLLLEFYDNPTGQRLASLEDCNIKKRYFVQTVGDSLRVYKRDDNGQFVESGKAGKGYVEDNSILLRNIIGKYKNDSHLSGVEINAVSDESWRNLYVIQRNQVENQGK